jgi:hypothetical protein
MSSANKARGTRYEREIVDYLSPMFDTQRLPRTGAKDEGDVEVRFNNFRLIIEAKNHKALALADWLKQAEVEANNREDKLTDTACVPVVFAKRRGKGTANSYVIMDAEEFTLLLKLLEQK